MKRFGLFIALVVTLLAVTGSHTSFAQTANARVRAVHASPDTPAVDVYVNGAAAFKGATFFGVTDYASLPAATYKIDVFAASANGQGTPAISVPALPLDGGKDYTAVAYGLLSGSPKVTLVPFVDDNSAPAAGKARVRFIHASPDTPAVDIAVTGGPVLFSNVAPGTSGGYVSVDAGTYDLEARPAGTTTAALKVPGVTVEAGKVYTVYAVGLLKGTGNQALAAHVSVDATFNQTAPTTAPAEPTMTPAAPGMPNTGLGGGSAETGTGNVLPLAVLAGLIAILALVGFRRIAVRRS